MWRSLKSTTRRPYHSDNKFDFMNRPATMLNWSEIVRVLRHGGTYLSQRVGPGTDRELTDFLMASQSINSLRDPERATRDAQTAGLTIVNLRQESLRVE